MKESLENLDIKLDKSKMDIPYEDPNTQDSLLTEEETIEDGYSGEYDDYIQETNNKIHQEISVAGSIKAWEANYKN